jgi:hypothetical protein
MLKFKKFNMITSPIIDCFCVGCDMLTMGYKAQYKKHTTRGDGVNRIAPRQQCSYKQ